MIEHKVTWEDVPEDVKTLVDFGIFTKEEVIEKCNASYKPYYVDEEELKRERELEEARWKHVEIELEIEADERYCYHDNKVTLEIYVPKEWGEKEILDYAKEELWIQIKNIK